MLDLHPLLADERAGPLELDLDLGAQVHHRAHAEIAHQPAHVARGETLQVVGAQEHAGRRRPDAAQRKPPEVAHVKRSVRDVVRDVTGYEPRDLRIRRGPDGLLAFLTVAVPGDRPLGEAHEAAGEIERRVRDASPEVNEVVVHTEPG